MEAKAQLNYLRISPRKVRLVADLIKGKSVEQAAYQLKIVAKGASQPLQKLLQSAVANAINAWQVSREDLIVKNVVVNGGPTLHRWQPRAMGRATPIRKRSSHIILTVATAKQIDLKKVKAAAAKKAEVSAEDKEVKKSTKKASKPQRAAKGVKTAAGVKRKIFSRKTGQA
jgi:large subunit ribosomal protein L22